MTSPILSKDSIQFYKRKKFLWSIYIVGSILGTFLAIVFAAMFGPAGPFGPTSTSFLTVSQVLYELFINTYRTIASFLMLPASSDSSIPKTLVWNIRLPRVLMGALAGMALATAGAVMQALFRNPMADPYIIGVASGASVGASFAIVAGGTIGFLAGYTLPFFAFIGALLSVFLVYTISTVRGSIKVDTLLLSGIAIGSFMSALTSFLTYISGEYLRPIVFWLMGGLSLVEGEWESITIAAVVIIPSCLFVFFYARPLNLLLLGEESAQYRGLNVPRVQKFVLIIASLITGVTVAFTGVIGFVGLIVPHMVRIVTGPDHRILLPVSAFTGATFLILADVLAKTILFPVEIPVGIITAFCGAPFFLYLLRKHKRTTLIV